MLRIRMAQVPEAQACCLLRTQHARDEAGQANSKQKIIIIKLFTAGGAGG